MPRNRHKSPEEKTKAVFDKYLKENSTVICSVSGGPDSVFLLKCLIKFSKKTPIKIVVGHINHSLRGIEAELDAKFVEEMAKAHNLPFNSTKVDTMAIAKSKKASIEEIGREIRYDFTNELYKKYKADYVATAHHADDNLETILLNFIRGSGLRGLSGMRETSTKKNGLKLFRPLLSISKEEIQHFLDEEEIPYRIDQTNWDTTIPRNFLRHDIIPKLKSLNPNLQNTVLKNSHNTREINDWIKQETNDWIAKNSPSADTFDLKAIQSLAKPVQKAILLSIYKKKEGHTKNISAIHIDEVLKVINKNIGRKQKKLGKYTVEIQKGTFILK
jgi:tRNA(Ile)-lysidine synthase